MSIFDMDAAQAHMDANAIRAVCDIAEKYLDEHRKDERVPHADIERDIKNCRALADEIGASL